MSRLLNNPLARSRALPAALVALFFVSLLGVGLAVHDDYGVGWDDSNNNHYGNITLDYARHVFDAIDETEYLRRYREELTETEFWSPVDGRFAKTHGPVFEVLLVLAQRALDHEDPREQMLFRHLGIFLFFCVGVFFFFVLVRRALGSWKLGLLGSLLLVLSPRIFAHSFYNSMDIPFLTVYVICVYTLLRYLERTTLRNALWHAVACGVLIDSRIAGIIMPALTVGFLFVEVVLSSNRKVLISRALISLLAYTVLISLLVVLMWPVLWTDPVGNFFSSFGVSANDPWEWWEMYMGQKVSGSQVPWHFTLVWMLITTPLIYSALTLVGLWGLARSWERPQAFYRNNRAAFVALMCFAAPLIAVGVFGSTLFIGWRHMYFVYPCFLMFSLLGVRRVWDRLGEVTAPGRRAYGRAALAGFIAICMIGPLVFMIRSHPHQITYFNSLVGGLAGARDDYQVGYWGPEYRDGLEYLANNVKTSSGKYRVFLSDKPDTLMPVMYNAGILSGEDRAKFEFVKKRSEAEFFMTNYCAHIPRYDFKEIWSRKVEGVKILSVYRITQ